jgi:hypothetical protein
MLLVFGHAALDVFGGSWLGSVRSALGIVDRRHLRLISSQRLARIRVIIFRWRGESGGEADNRDAEAAERERLRDEDKHVVSIGWGDGGKTIEHEAKSEPSPKD